YLSYPRYYALLSFPTRRSSDLGLSFAEIWCNESQERYVLAILPQDLARFKSIAERERCPWAVVGVATEERQLQVTWGEGLPTDLVPNQANPITPRPVDMPLEVLLGNTPKLLRDVQRQPTLEQFLDL